jgi:L-arabinose isomerase
VHNRTPRIGLMGIMQELYDDMLPGITERQGRYLAEVGAALADVAECVVEPPARNRDDIERVMREYERKDLDGVLIVNLTYGPGQRTARALGQARLPLCLANIQPDPHVTAEWDMADMTYNQGIHGAQDTANAMVRAGVAFDVVSEDWHSEAFRDRVGRWARAAAAVTAWRRLKVAQFGYAMNDMGDIRFDEGALLRALGPNISVIAPGELYRATVGVTPAEIAEVIAFEDERFDIDPRLSDTEREDHVRMQVAIERLLEERGCEAFSTHFDAIGEDGRFARLPFAAASSLMAKGYGFAGEGDMLTAALVRAGHVLIGDAHFTEMYAMDFPSDSVLMSHMGEGNWRIARGDRPVRLIKRPIAIGGLDDPPTFLFEYEPGPATLATLVALGGESFRLVVCEGENLDGPELPGLEMPYGHFRPDVGVRACLDAWLRLGGPHHQVMNLGRHGEAWRAFCEQAGLEFALIDAELTSQQLRGRPSPATSERANGSARTRRQVR